VRPIKASILLLWIFSPVFFAAHSQVLPDSFEPDNSNSSAKQIGFNVPQKRSIHFVSRTSVDIDVVAVFLPEPGNIQITIEGEINDSLSGLGYGLTGADANGNYNISGIETFGTQQNLPSGLYYLNIIGSGRIRDFNKVANYSLTVSYTPGRLETINLPRDQFEEDDSIFTARPAIDREIQNRTFHNDQDVDWIAFRLDGCVNILAEAAAIPTSGSKLAMRLWDSDFKLIESKVTEQSFNDQIVQDFFLRELRRGLYFISLQSVGTSLPDRPAPHAFRISGFLCEQDNSFLPPVINLLLSD